MPWVAVKTLALMEEMVKADQGAAFRQALEPLIAKMDDAYRGASDPYRFHLGASLIGRECARALWYGYHWCKQPTFDGRLLRLFNRGHLEEARFLALLQMIGVELWYDTPDGGQIKFSDCFGHFGSALDGVGRGIPDVPDGAVAYTEFKTSAEKGFNKMKKVGMREAKPEHYVQCQVCMYKMNLPFCLYMVVNKNNDELYAEILEFDGKTGKAYVDRAKTIIFSPEPPTRISEVPGWWQCKFCDFKLLCHGREVADVNCRTCQLCSPTEAGTWDCQRGEVLTREDKRPFTGCGGHIYKPSILNGVKFMGWSPDGSAMDLALPSGERILHGPNNVTSVALHNSGL